MTDNKEYIERKRISDVLPPMCPHGDEYSSGYNTCLETVKGLIREAPAADVVEVVRCEKCKHNAPEKALIANGIWCEYWGFDPAPNDFCRHGERKDMTDETS